jgi:DNA invertase Pin-like site-specific DNA recombinase
MKEKRAAIYTRRFQATILDKQSDTEIERCKVHCLALNYIVSKEHIYAEQTTDEQDRPELQRLLAAAKNGLIDTVVITGPGRLSSSPADLLTLVEQFKAAGVQIETIEPSFLDGLLNKTPAVKSSPTRYRKEKKRSHWTEHAIHGDRSMQERRSPPPRAAIYAGSFRTTPAKLQIQQLKTRCQIHGYSLDSEHIYYDTDPDVNGSNRPKLQALIEAATNGHIDVIVLNNIQDFSQRPSHLINIIQIFKDAGVVIETIE